MLKHVVCAINVLLTCAANLLERELSPEQQRPFRDHVRTVHLRPFGLDPDSERHARAALLGLIDSACRPFWMDGIDPRSEAAHTEAAQRVLDASAWVHERYAEDFPDYASRLSTDEKQERLRRIVAGWYMNSNTQHGIPAPMAFVWRELEELGQGVFQTTGWKDWRDNVWEKLRSVVLGVVTGG
jgi:hypothetical protein